MSVGPYRMLERTDLSEQTYQILQDQIIRRELKPGDKIAVDEVAAALRVSRTPVMIALQQLANDGLVEIVPQRGTFVRGLSARDVAEFSEIRLMIEEYALEHLIAAGAMAEFVAQAQPFVRAMNQVVANGEYLDHDMFVRNDHELHRLLVSFTGNQHLLRIYEQLNVHMQVTRAHFLSNVQGAGQALSEHAAILAALEEGDAERAHRALRAHITNVRDRILDIVAQHGGLL